MIELHLQARLRIGERVSVLPTAEAELESEVSSTCKCRRETKVSRPADSVQIGEDPAWVLLLLVERSAIDTSRQTRAILLHLSSCRLDIAAFGG